jgi:hypothetical protein
MNTILSLLTQGNASGIPMRMSRISKGYCYLCGANLGKAAMKNHISRLHAEEDGQECRLLKIEGYYDKNYWLFLDIPAEKTLKDIDAFLRKIWLECCGHMSGFFYPGYNEIGSGRKLQSFGGGEKFLHHYDFGSTTETLITVLGNAWRKPQKIAIRLLARNAPPVFQCEDCGKTADTFCLDYSGECDGYFYCEECCKKHEEYEEQMFPVVNSPRMGVCGYAGEYDTFEFDPKSVTH